MEDRHRTMWTFRGEGRLGVDATAPEQDFVGFEVHAVDGEVGKVDEATYEPGFGRLVVDTGWRELKRVVLPAGVVERVDPHERRVYVRCTEDQIKDAPEIPFGSFEEEDLPERLRSVTDYYGPGGRGWRDSDEATV